MRKREWDAESNGKLKHLFFPSKAANLVSEFAMEDLQPWCLSLQCKTCPWAEHSDDEEDYDDDEIKEF